MSKFFGHFPTRDYPDVGKFKDFTPALQIDEYVQTVPYQQPAGTRPDVIASKYYGDPVLEWILFLTNNIDNPYDLIYLTDDQFQDQVVRVYGSVERAHRITKYFRNNHRSDLGSTISQQQYNSLPDSVKPLFDVKRDFMGEVVGYTRKKIDTTRNTSQIYKAELAAPAEIAIGEPVVFKTGEVVHATGQVSSIIGNDVYVEHIVGTPDGDTLSDYTNDFSMVDVSFIAESITADEAAYYERVSAYQQLYEANERKRELKVVDKQFAGMLERKLREAFE